MQILSCKGTRLAKEHFNFLAMLFDILEWGWVGIENRSVSAKTFWVEEGRRHTELASSKKTARRSQNETVNTATWIGSKICITEKIFWVKHCKSSEELCIQLPYGK